MYTKKINKRRRGKISTHWGTIIKKKVLKAFRRRAENLPVFELVNAA